MQRVGLILVWTFFCLSVTGSEAGVVSRQYSNKIDLKATVPTLDGGYVTCGSSGVVMKLDGYGIPVWSRRLLLGSAFFSEMSSLTELPDANIIAVGYRFNRNTGDSDAIIWKIDPTGRTLFRKLVATPDAESLLSISTTADGNILMVGNEEGDGWVVKMSPEGHILWSKAIGTTSLDSFYSFVESSNEYTAVGSARVGSPDQSLMVVRLTSSGEILWKKLYSDESGFRYVEGLSVAQTTKGASLVAGTYESDGLLMKISATGQPVWPHTFSRASLAFRRVPPGRRHGGRSLTPSGAPPQTWKPDHGGGWRA